MAGAFDFGSVLESRGLTGGGGVVQNLTNFLTGKRGNLSGPNDFTAIYDYFFRTLLSSTNGLPIRPLWILFFDSFPSALILTNMPGELALMVIILQQLVLIKIDLEPYMHKGLKYLGKKMKLLELK